MTPEQVQALTNDKIRVSVAEAVGWTGIHEEDRSGFGGYRGYRVTIPGYCYVDFVPNYPADLNACAEAERMIVTKLQEVAYIEHLTAILNRDNDGTFRKLGAGPIDYARASARQRCEAFILTMTTP